MKLGEKNGMVMALSLFHHAESLTLVAGYENGLGTVAQLDTHGNWIVKYRAQCHSQPVLSLDISPSKDFFITSSADAIIAKHPLPRPPTAEPAKDETQNAQPSIEKTLPNTPTPGPTKSLLSAALSNNSLSTPAQPPRPSPAATQVVATKPLATINTKHSGQQSLVIRSDGRIFATAGWDAKVRVYSAKTLKEVAVLKWHQVGCYAAAFAAVERDAESAEQGSVDDGGVSTGEVGQGEGGQQAGEGSSSLVPVPKLVEMTVRDKRIRQARTAHWLAVGSKDGKVSLWDVF